MRYILVLIAAVLMLSASSVLLPSTSVAQVSVSLGFNVERQPVWGPTGYDHVDYYYLPDIGVYYSVSQNRYYYSDRGRWRNSRSLPSRYHGYDLYNSYKVVVNDPKPYLHDDTYREQYASYKGRHDQENIRDSRDQKYFVNPKHPEHKNWVREQKQHRHDNGNGQDNRNGQGDRNGQNNGNDNNRGNGNGYGR